MSNNIIYNNDKINLSALFKFFSERKGKMIIAVSCGIFFGLVVALFTEKEYSSSTTIVTQTSSNSAMGKIGSLASLAGFNLGGGSKSAIPPELYEKIVDSYSFRKEILNSKLSIGGISEKVSFIEFFENHHKKSIFKRLKSVILDGISSILTSESQLEGSVKKAKSVLNQYTVKEEVYSMELSDLLSIEVADLTGSFEFKTVFPNAEGSASLAALATEILQKKIIEFEIKKSQESLNFIIDRHKEQRDKLNSAQVNLAKFVDKNSSLVSSIAKVEITKLESEYNLHYELFTELSKQLEAKRISVKKNTPVFTIIKEVEIPNYKSSPKKLKLMIRWGFIFILVFLILSVRKTYKTNPEIFGRKLDN